MEIDISKPIVPFREMAGIKLYQKLDELMPILDSKNAIMVTINKYLVRYEIANELFLFFHLGNRKLYKLTSLASYQGSLWNTISAGVGMDMVLKLYDDFTYDDFEEVYVSERGVFIETDPLTDTVTLISIFIKELETDEFDKLEW